MQNRSRNHKFVLQRKNKILTETKAMTFYKTEKSDLKTKTLKQHLETNTS